MYFTIENLKCMNEEAYSVHITDENAPALTHLPRICHSRFALLTLFDVMTSFCDVTRRHDITSEARI